MKEIQKKYEQTIGDDQYAFQIPKKISHGEGRLVKLNGHVLEGFWEEGILKEGTLSYPNGNVY